jgi:hypothetical protein
MRKRSPRLTGVELCVIAGACGGFLGAVIGGVYGASTTPGWPLSRSGDTWIGGIGGLLIGAIVGVVLTGTFLLVVRYDPDE